MSAGEAYWSRVLLAYPAWYREERGEEVLGVLMEAHPRRPAGETLALVRHGLALRLRDPRRRGAWRHPSGVAGLLMACLMATAGGWTALSSALAWASLRWWPDPSSVPWVDPLAVSGVCWVVAFALLLARSPRGAAASAWLGLACHVAVLAGAFGSEGSLTWPWLTDQMAAAMLLRLAPSLALPLLLLRPDALDDAVRQVGRRLPAAAFIGGVLALWVVDREGGDWQVVAMVGAVGALVVLVRERVALRGALALGAGFAWPLATPLADGAWVPHDPWLLGAGRVLLPIVGLVAALVVVRWLESDRLVRGWLAERLDAAAHALRPPVS